MEIEDIILEFFPDIPLPKRIELQNELAPYISLINRHEYLRRMTIVEVLHRFYVGSVKDEIVKIQSVNSNIDAPQ